MAAIFLSQKYEVWSLTEMLEITANKLIAPLTYIASTVKGYEFTLREMRKDAKSHISVDREQIILVINALKGIKCTSELINMKLTKRRVDEAFENLVKQIEYETISYQQLSSVTESFKGLLLLAMDELDTYTFLSILPENSEIYKHPLDKFDQRILDRFPKSRFELEEAGNCFALGRYTACIFHLMRAMEDGVKVLAVEIGATYSSAQGETLAWGILTANIKGKIDLLEKGESKDDWYEVHSILHSVNRAFRTKTAHPEKVYTQEQARTAMTAVNSFLSQMVEFTQA